MSERRFYVYELVDPRTGLVFYVGKGCRQRAWQHEADVRNGRPSTNRRKDQRITEVLSSGRSVQVKIVASYDDEAEAYSHEAELIASTPGLTNMLEGGRGGWALTKDEALRRLELRPARLARIKVIKDRKKLAAWLAMAEQWAGVIVPNVSNGDQLGQEFIQMVRGIVAAPLPEPIKY